VNYEVPVGGGEMTLRIYDLRGQLVRTLVDGAQPAGRHAAIWDGRDEAGRPLPSGVYVGRLQAGAVVETRAMVLAK
jgi:flagellar hook assembly protein FlgD